MTPQYSQAFADIRSGFSDWRMWSRLGWLDNARRYRRTALGPLWTVLSLGIFVVVLGFVWSNLWKQDPKVYLPFLAAGMLAWLFFSALPFEGSATFTSAEMVIKQIPVSFTMLACAIVWRHLILFGQNLIIYVLVCLYAGLWPGWNLLLLIPCLVLLSLNGVWIVIVTGMSCARFRDIQQIIQSLMQLAMFVTPVFWAADNMPQKVRWLIDYNLLYHYIEIIRSPLLGHAPTAWTWIMVGCATIVGWTLTIFLFARFRRRIAYWI
jgi:ABC-type polysaccharide/polyol phosphate export permease